MLVFLLFLIAFFNSGVVSAEVSLNFGVYASDKPTTMVKKFRPILNDLEQIMSLELEEPVSIRMQVSSSYEAGVHAVASGNVDFARLGPASYVRVMKLDPSVRLVAMKDPPSADTLSQQYLLQHGIKAADLGSYAYLGRHDRVGYAVAAGKFDAGALKESTYKKLLKRGVALRPIATFENVTKPWVAKSGLDERVFSALRLALLDYKNPSGLKALGKDGFVSGSPEDYVTINAAVRHNPEFFE